MIILRPAHERGHADHGWLDARHHFSFANYYDPARMGWGAIRVWNDDTIAPQTGFPPHPHRDMEIISYVINGALAHRDSLGNQGTIRPGEVQRMSAGTGVVHSEFNAHAGTTHFLQIWIFPQQQGIAPSYEQKAFAEADKRGRLRVVASADGRDGSVTIHQDATLYAGLFDGAESAVLPLAPGRLAYVHVVQGRLEVNGKSLQAGDALKLEGESQVLLDKGETAEVLVFDLPPLG